MGGTYALQLRMVLEYAVVMRMATGYIWNTQWTYIAIAIIVISIIIIIIIIAIIITLVSNSAMAGPY